MLVKQYGEGPNSPERKYSPSEYKGSKKIEITGNPLKKTFQRPTSIERQNLTMRMSILHARLAAFMERYPLPHGSGPAPGRPCDPRLDNPYFKDFFPKSEGSTGSAGSSGVTSTGTRVPGSDFAASQHAEPTLKSG